MRCTGFLNLPPSSSPSLTNNHITGEGCRHLVAPLGVKNKTLAHIECVKSALHPEGPGRKSFSTVLIIIMPDLGLPTILVLETVKGGVARRMAWQRC
jgi:hypothetical protein